VADVHVAALAGAGCEKDCGSCSCTWPAWSPGPCLACPDLALSSMQGKTGVHKASRPKIGKTLQTSSMLDMLAR